MLIFWEMIRIDLRDYQQQSVIDVRNSWKTHHKHPCLVIACGGGKSCILAEIARLITNKKRFVLVILHREELQRQIIQTFRQWGVDMDYCLVGMVQTVSRRLDTLQEPALIMTDEGHHSLANSYKKVYSYFPKSFGLSVTATPTRLSGGGLGDVCDDLIIGKSAKWLITNKYLAPYKYYSVPVADFADIKVSRGEYDIKQLSEIMEDNKIYGDTISNYRKIANNKKTIVYCSSVKSAHETAEEFVLQGYAAAALDGKSEKNYRQETMNKFRNGEIKILCNADLFGEGIDIQDVECVILLRKTKSLTLFIQQSMRCLRIDKNNPDKIGIIIDHVGNIFEHGFPDTEREWTLETVRQKQANEIKIKTCPQCYAVIEQDTLICPFCGCNFESEVRERKEAERIQAELIEITERETQRLRDLPISAVREFTTWEQLNEYRQVKKFHIMWAVRKCLDLGLYLPPKYERLRSMIK